MMKWEKWVAGVAMASTLTMTGCSTYNPVRVNHQQLAGGYTYYRLDPPLYKGDTVHYLLSDGTQSTAILEKTTPQTLQTDTGLQLPLANVISLQRKDLSKGKTAAAIGAGVGATTIIALALLTFTVFAGTAALLTGA